MKLNCKTKSPKLKKIFKELYKLRQLSNNAYKNINKSKHCDPDFTNLYNKIFETIIKKINKILIDKNLYVLINIFNNFTYNLDSIFDMVQTEKVLSNLSKNIDSEFKEYYFIIGKKYNIIDKMSYVYIKLLPVLFDFKYNYEIYGEIKDNNKLRDKLIDFCICYNFDNHMGNVNNNTIITHDIDSVKSFINQFLREDININELKQKIDELSNIKWDDIIKVFKNKTYISQDI